MQIRKAMESDLERLTAIYNQAILDGNRTCDTEPFPTEARRTWLLEHDQERFPLFTCLLKGKVVGYAYLSPYRSGRPAWRTRPKSAAIWTSASMARVLAAA